MKTLRYIAAAWMAVLLSIGLPSPPKVAAQPGVSVSFQIFFNSLSPFGRWSSHPQYGSVWIPAVSRDFHPYYTDGRWVMTEYGNTWVSDYEWGWAPFHYGRWFYDDYMGWAWVPDYTWGPGWVNWRDGGGYYGWAPLMPGINIRLAINLPINFWVFVPHRHFMSPRWHRYSVPRARVTNIYNQTTIINNYYTHNNYEYAYGPRSSEIQARTRSAVPVYTYTPRTGNGRESVARTTNTNVRRAVEVREQSLAGRTAATGSARSSSPEASPSARSSSSARTGTPAEVSPRSRNPVAAPAERSSERSTSPSVRSTSPARTSPAPDVSPRSSVPAARPAERTPERSASPAPRSASPARTAPAAGPSRSREATAPRTSPAPTQRSAPERAAPARSSAPRPAASPARSSAPTRSTSPAASPSGRSARGERGG